MRRSIAFAATVLLSLSFSPGADTQDPLAEIIAAGEKAIQSSDIPGGSIQVVHDGKVVLNHAFGKASSRSSRAWRTDEVVAIASMSKPITATLVAVLVEEGMLDFSDPVSKYLEEFSGIKMKSGEAVRSPTIAECLSHTAGFPGGTLKGVPKDSPARSGGSAEMVAEILRGGLVAEPGTSYAYTFRGFAVVAGVVEKVTGKKFSAVLKEKLLDPLEMSETGFVPTEEMVPRMPLVAGSKITDDRIAEYLRKKMKDWENPAGGLFSTADDLVKFYQFHLDEGKAGDRQLVSPAVLKRMYQAQPGAKSYGIGFNVSQNEIRHGGATGTSGWANLKKKIIFVGLTQAGSKNARPFFNSTTKLVEKHFAK